MCKQYEKNLSFSQFLSILCVVWLLNDSMATTTTGELLTTVATTAKEVQRWLYVMGYYSFE